MEPNTNTSPQNVAAAARQTSPHHCRTARRSESGMDGKLRGIKEGGGISSMKTPDVIGALKEQRRAQSKLWRWKC